MPRESKILVLDDDKSVLLNTVCYLEDEGFIVISAESAEDALNFLDAEAPGVAVVDMRLPGMDGNDFIREAVKIKPDLKFIVMTGSSQYSIPADLRALGITQEDILKKPLAEMKRITDRIEFLLQ